MGKKLAARLKLVLGRHLSPKQMANAIEESEAPDVRLRSDKSKKIDELEKRISGEFMRFRQKFEYMTTPDASHGWKQSHTGYYPYKTINETYDSKGRLKIKEISHGDVYRNKYLYRKGYTVTKVFNPPGRLVGRREK